MTDEKEKIPWILIFALIVLAIGIILITYAMGQYIQAEQLVGNLPSINQTIANNISQSAQNFWRIP